MQRPDEPEPTPRVTGHDPLAKLDSDLASFEASRKRAPPAVFGMGRGAEAGFRLLSQMLGGILGGVGLGWLVDHYAHTKPLGLVLGLVIGSGLSIWSTVRAASQIGAPGGASPGTARPAPDDEDE